MRYPRVIGIPRRRERLERRSRGGVPASAARSLPRRRRASARAGSCSWPFSTTRMPQAMHSSTAAGSVAETRASSTGSTFAPSTAAMSSAPRAVIDNRVARASTASRTVGGQPVGNRERLRDEKRIAAGRLEQATGVQAGLDRERADRVRGEPARLEPDDARHRRDITGEHADRLVRRAVVAIGHEQHRRNPLDPTCRRRAARPASRHRPSGSPRPRRRPVPCAASVASRARAIAAGSAVSAIGSPSVAAMSCSGPSGAGTASGSQLPT